MEIKRIAGIAGKTLATIVCPPLGGALWFKKSRFETFALGAFFSICCNLGISSKDSFPKQIYDSPKISLMRRIHHQKRTVIGSLIFPWMVLLDRDYRITELESDKITYSVKGKDVLTFADGKWQLDFGPERKFSIYGNKENTGYVSVQQAQERVENCRQNLETYLGQGDIFEVRDAREELQGAKDDLERAQVQYDSVKQLYKSATEKMNHELAGEQVD